MQQFTGVYTATFLYTAMSTAVTQLELTAPSTAAVALISAGIGPRGAILDQLQEVNIFRNDAAGTGTALVPEPTHEGMAAFSGTVRRTITAEGGTPDDLLEDGFHFQNGWKHAPIPEEFFTCQPSSILGFRFPVAPDAAMGIAVYMTFGEIG